MLSSHTEHFNPWGGRGGGAMYFFTLYVNSWYMLKQISAHFTLALASNFLYHNDLCSSFMHCHY